MTSRERGRVVADGPAGHRAVGYQDWCPHSARYVKDLVPGASANAYAMHGNPLRNDPS